MNVEFINDPDFMYSVLMIFSYGLVSWFMGWGVSLVTSLFIKIFEKGV